MANDRFFRDSRPSSTLPDRLCSDIPVSLDEPDARSPPTRSCGARIGVECVRSVGLIWGFLLGVVPPLVLIHAHTLPAEFLGFLIRGWDWVGEDRFRIYPGISRAAAREQVRARV